MFDSPPQSHFAREAAPTTSNQAWIERAALFDQSLGLLCVVGFDGYMKHWNPSWNYVLGYSSEQMMAIRLRELVHPDDVDDVNGIVASVRTGLRRAAVEARFRCKDGTYRTILWNAVPCLEQQAFFATGQDITDRKLVEEQLRSSEERFQLVATATRQAVWDWEPRENRLWTNATYRQSYGGPNLSQESVVEWWRRHIHPLDRDRVMAQLPPADADGRQQWTLEYRLLRLNGTYAHVLDRGYVIYDRQREPARMLGCLMDVSELKETELKLRESEERFQLVTRATREAVWDWELSRGTVWRSEGFTVLFGYQPDDIEDQLSWWVERIHPDDRPRVMAQLPTPGENTPLKQCSYEYRFRRRDGTYADVLDRGFFMFRADGVVYRMVGSMLDLTERRRAEELAHMHRAELAHIARVRTMGEIATGLAHELNQPLTAIANYAESCAQALSASGPKAHEQVAGWLEKIVSNTDRVGQMIRRLRGFTRKSEPRRSTVEINDLVQEVIDLLEAESRLQEVRVRWNSIPPAYALLDRVQVQQVLVNLLRNAYEAMAALPPDQRQVVITALSRGRHLEISVEDCGQGIPEENLPRVFDAFFTNKADGVGVGLAISRSIIEDHGGRLWVEPNPSPRGNLLFHGAPVRRLTWFRRW